MIVPPPGQLFGMMTRVLFYRISFFCTSAKNFSEAAAKEDAGKESVPVDDLIL
jgi:hypothetical protein